MPKLKIRCSDQGRWSNSPFIARKSRGYYVNCGETVELINPIYYSDIDVKQCKNRVNNPHNKKKTGNKLTGNYNLLTGEQQALLAKSLCITIGLCNVSHDLFRILK